MLAQFKLAGAAELLNQLVPSTEPAQVSESSLSDVATVMHARLHAELAVMTARADAARSAQVVSGSGRQAEEFPPLLATTVATACTLHETDPLPPLPPTGASPSRLVQLAKLYAAFVVSNLLPPLECLLVLLRLLHCANTTITALREVKGAPDVRRCLVPQGGGDASGTGRLPSQAVPPPSLPSTTGTAAAPPSGVGMQLLEPLRSWTALGCSLFTRCALTALVPWLSRLPHSWASTILDGVTASGGLVPISGTSIIPWTSSSHQPWSDMARGKSRFRDCSSCGAVLAWVTLLFAIPLPQRLPKTTAKSQMRVSRSTPTQ